MGAVLGTAQSAAAALEISADPPLTPAFNPGVRDYVSRCAKGTPLRLSVNAPDGGKAAIDGRRARRGSSTAKIALRTGRRAVVRVRSGGRTTRYHVRCFPRNFPSFSATRSGRPQAAYYLVNPTGGGPSRWVVMFDAHGAPIWWLRTRTASIDAKLLPNGHVAFARYRSGEIFGVRRSSAYEEYTLRGRRVRVIKTVGSPTDIHDLQRLPNGNSLLITYRPRDGVDLRSQGGPENATVLDGEVQEVTPKGRRVWRWNSKDHVDLSERSVAGPLGEPVELPDGRKAYNLVHLNSIEPHGRGRLLLSMRLPSALYDIDRRSGRILWKLGGTETPASLRVVGDSQPSPHFGGQHDARVLRDGTVTVFDNGTGRARPPRAARFRVDAAARTATLVEEVVDPAVQRSPYAGGARRLAGGNWLVSWGGTPVINELAPDGRQVFGLRLENGFFSYRAFPVGRGRLRASTLRRAMDAKYPRRRP